MRWIYVMGGGAVGSLLRYAVGIAVLSRYTGPFPLATFLVNITGSFVIGMAMSRLPASSSLKPLVVTGLIGGYTTFSSLEWETFAAAQGGHTWIAVSNLILSVVLGYLACLAGVWIGR